MTDTDTADTPDSAEQIQAVEVTAPMTIEEAAKQVEARKSQNRGETPEAEVTEPEADAEGEVKEAEDEAKEEESTEADEGVLSNDKYVESLNDDERAELAIELGSGEGKAIGKQRKEIRELKEKLESANQAKAEAIKLAPSADVPFPELRTVEAVDTKIEEIDEALSEWTDRMTFEQTEKYDEKSEKDVKGVEKDGQFYSLQALKEWRDGQRKILKGLRSQKTSVRKLEKLFEDEDVKIETNKVNLGIEEGSKSSELYESYLADPQFQVLKVQMPELAAKLLDVFAHAAVSEGGTAKKKPANRAAPKAKNSNSVPKGGVGTPSNQAQLSVLERTINDATKSMPERKAAAVQLRQFKSQLR